MDIEIRFQWDPPPKTVLRDVVERSIRDDIEGTPEMQPCHRDKITVQLNPTGPLETIFEVKIVCSCGKTYKNLQYSEDGSFLS